MVQSSLAQVPGSPASADAARPSTIQLVRQLGLAVAVSSLVFGALALSIYLANKSQVSTSGSSQARLAADKAWEREDWNASVKYYDQILDVDPYNPIAAYRKAFALQSLLFAALDQGGGASPAQDSRSVAQAALDAYQATLDHLALRKHVYYNMACIYARLDQTDEALDAIERAIRSGMSVYEFGRDRSFQKMRLDPRFRQLTQPPPDSGINEGIMVGGR